MADPSPSPMDRRAFFSLINHDRVRHGGHRRLASRTVDARLRGRMDRGDAGCALRRSLRDQRADCDGGRTRLDDPGVAGRCGALLARRDRAAARAHPTGLRRGEDDASHTQPPPPGRLGRRGGCTRRSGRTRRHDRSGPVPPRLPLPERRRRLRAYLYQSPLPAELAVPAMVALGREAVGGAAA